MQFDYNALEAGYQPFDINPKQQAKKKKGNLLTSLIPTAGGTAGALGGAAAGAAIGSVVPIAGTAVGGLIGAILGGAGGSALGKVGQNAAEGESDLSQGVLNEALLGGATSTPIGAGIKLARAGVKLGTGLGKTAASDLIQQAGMQTIGKGTAARLGVSPVQDAVQDVAGGTFSASNRLRNAGNKTLLSQYGTISKPFARSTNPTETIDTLANAGLTNPADVERVASSITGGNGIVTRAVSDAVGKAGGVDTSTVRQVFNDALDNYGLVEKDRASLQKVFDAQMKRLTGGAKGSLSTTANPTEVLSTMKAIEKRAANLAGKGDNNRLSTPERQDQANVLNLVRDELEDKLYTGAGANKNLSSVLTPQLREQIVSLHPNNQQWAKYVDDKIIGAKTVGDLRSSVAPFVRGGKIISEGESNALTAGGRMGNAFAGGANGVLGMAGQAATNLFREPAARAAGNTLRSASTLAAGSAVPKAVGQSVPGVLARQGAGRLLTNGLMNDPTQAETIDPNTMADPSLLASTNMGTPEDVQQPTNPFGVQLSDVASQMTQALANGDTKGYGVLSDLYDRINDYESKAGTGAQLGATAQASLATSSNALNTLDQLQQLYSATGGGSGRIGGTVQNVLGNAGLNDNTAAYNSLAQSSVSQLAKAINGSGQVSDADAAALVRALPLTTDNPAVAAAKFQALKQRLAVAQQNTIQFGGGGNDLSSILAQYQQ